MLDKNAIEELKSALEKEKQELEKLLSNIAEKDSKSKDWQAKFPNLNENADQSLEDSADEVEEFNNNLAVSETLEIKLKDINDALKKIENDTYGKCEQCDKEIPIERLRINPSTKYCPECDNEK